MTESNKTTYEIVESPILGDPLAPLRMQDQDPTADWRALLHYHNEDRVHDLPNGLLEDMAREIKNIFGDAVTNITFRHFTFDKDGNMVEI